MTGQVEHLNPDTLIKNPAFTNVVVVSGSVRTVYIGGQDAVTPTGQVVGIGDIAAQTEQILKNIQAALQAAGAGLEHIIKWNIYIVQGQPLQPGFQVFQKYWGNRPNPPTITAAYVAGLARSDLWSDEFLVEIDAIAVVPE